MALEFRGTWDPASGIYPIVPHTITSAYYLVSGPGIIENQAFTQGDWLIYIEEAGAPSGSGTWYRTAGGMLQLATDPIATPVVLTAADISDFGTAVTAAILVDGTTIIKNVGTNTLTAIAGSGPVVIDVEDDNPNYVAPHTHLAAEVTDLRSAVRVALGPGSTNSPFFANTAVTNAVILTYDSRTSTVSADVKIDNTTIVKNKYGQLVATRNRPITIADVTDLDTYLDNYLQDVVAAEVQILSATSPSNGAWYPAGYHNFGLGVRIGDALYLLNTDILQLRTDLDALTTLVNNQTTGAIPPDPVGPDTTLSLVLTGAPAFQAGTGAAITVIQDETPTTTETALFYKGRQGVTVPGATIAALLDSAVIGEVILNGAVDQDGAGEGALTITQDVDSYDTFPAFHNLYRSIKVRINPLTNLTAGAHTYQLRQILPESGLTAFSSYVSFHIDIPANVNDINIAAGVHLVTNPAAKYVSGVPTLDPAFTYIVAPMTVENMVGTAYGSKIARIEGLNTQIDNTANLAAASVPALPSPGTYGDAVTGPFSFHISDTYNENVTLAITPFNSAGEAGDVYQYRLGRIDSSVETSRVYSGDPTTLYPAIATTNGCGSVYNSAASLVGTYLGELQKLNRVYRWPTGSYTGGPNYTGATGVTVPSLSGTWRWATFKLASDIIGKVAFTLTFIGGNAAPGVSDSGDIISGWAANALSGVTDGIQILAKLGTSGWVDCNKAYPGYGIVINDGSAAMDISKSNAYTKRVTLGPSTATSTAGDLYVRIALPYGSTKQFESIEISEWA